MTLSMNHLGILTSGVDFEYARFVGYAVYVHRAITALSGDVLVQRVPRNALDVVIMFGDFMKALS